MKTQLSKKQLQQQIKQLRLESAQRRYDQATIQYLRHAMAHQLEHASKLQAELDQAVDSVNACFEAQAVMLEHINNLHQILGMEPIDNPFTGLEYVAFSGEAA